MNIKLLTVCDDAHKAAQLERSLIHHGWQYEIIIKRWEGFCTKLHGVYERILHSDIDAFFFADAYDSFVLGTMEEALSKINADHMISAEINCWPDSDLHTQYPATDSVFKHINSGGYYMSKEMFVRLFENDKPLISDDDQRWMTRQVLQNNMNIDYYASVWQSLCGITDVEFDIIGNRVQSKRYGNSPVIIHGNGKANMNLYYNLL